MVTNILADWFDRRRDAIEDVFHFARIISASHTPTDIIEAQLRFGSLALGRWAADVEAMQEWAQQGLGWMQEGSAASRAAAATRAAGKPLREAQQASG